jgi:hypothetical protein
MDFGYERNFRAGEQRSNQPFKTFVSQSELETVTRDCN